MSVYSELLIRAARLRAARKSCAQRMEKTCEQY
jgi:hypothetical protein